MRWLNYHHLLYFWTVAKEGTVTAAADKLSLAQPTISAQIRRLEDSLDTRLFKKAGRNLALTEAGTLVFRYADEIFSLGREMLDTLEGQPQGRPLRLTVGVADVLPKLATYRLLQPALEIDQPVQLRCLEGKPADLLARLAIHELDLVLCDTPIGPDVSIRAFSYLLGESDVAVFGQNRLAERCRDNFPRSLQDAPLLLPAENTAMRRSLNIWFDEQKISPRIEGEFEDSALMKVFGQAGRGLFFAPAFITENIESQMDVSCLGLLQGVTERFYAISLERKVRHPGVIAMTTAARREILRS